MSNSPDFVQYEEWAPINEEIMDAAYGLSRMLVTLVFDSGNHRYDAIMRRIEYLRKVSHALRIDSDKFEDDVCMLRNQLDVVKLLLNGAPKYDESINFFYLNTLLYAVDQCTGAFESGIVTK